MTMRHGSLKPSGVSSSSSSANSTRRRAPSNTLNSGYSRRTVGPRSIAEAMHSDVLDTCGVEPYLVIGASDWRVNYGAHPLSLRVHRSDQPNRSTAAMLPHPVRNIDTITITQRMHHRSDPRQIMTPSRETMPPTPPPRRGVHHRRPVSVIGERPLFAHLTKLNHTTATIVLGHPTRYLISEDSGNIHGDEGEVCGEHHNRNSRYRSNPASYATPVSGSLRAPIRSQRTSLACTERASSMSKRRSVILSVVLEGRTQAQTARLYGVSEGWVCKLVARWRAEGDAAFQARSRRPDSSPSKVWDETVKMVVNLRAELSSQGLDAGPHTISWHLQQRHQITVSPSTIRRRLVDLGLVEPTDTPP